MYNVLDFNSLKSFQVSVILKNLTDLQIFIKWQKPVWIINLSLINGRQSHKKHNTNGISKDQIIYIQATAGDNN